MKKIDIHLHAALDPVPGTEKFKISTGEAENWPEDFLKNMYGCVIWMKIVKKPLKRGSGNIKGREL